MTDNPMDGDFTNDGEQFSAPPSPTDPQSALPRDRQVVYAVENHPARATISAFQRVMLRRLAALLCTGTLAFTLTTWVLVQRVERTTAVAAVPQERGADTPEEGSVAANEPVKTARAQLDALNRGDIRAAYEMFSPHYRETASFDAFKALVKAHRSMFRTEEEELDSTSITPDRVRVDVHVQSEDDEHYIAHYTMARLKGRWFVDELRWVNADDEDEGLTSA